MQSGGATRHIQIQGHRGGYKPDNVLSTFTKSLESGLEAIELDVSIEDSIFLAGLAHEGQHSSGRAWR